MKNTTKRMIPLLALFAQARATETTPSTLATIKGPPKHIPRTDLPPSWTSTTTVYVTATSDLDPPTAQPGDLASYGYGQESDVAVSAVQTPEYSSTSTDAFTPIQLSELLSGTPTSATEPSFLVPLPSVFTPESVITILSLRLITVLSSLPTPIAQQVTSLTFSSITTSMTAPAAGDTPASSPPPPSTAAITTTSPTRKYGPTFGLSGLNGPDGLPSTFPLAPASSAMVHCASASGGLRPDGAIGRGCDSLFAHIMTCFTANEPWDSPYNSARTAAFRTCVCMSSEGNPFDEYSAMWKNFSGCAACLHSDIGGEFDIMPWLNLEARRIWSFCRSQEPNAFLFTLFLKNWYYGLTDHEEISDPPFEAAFSGRRDEGGMAALQVQYTGRPPLANWAWGASGLPSGQYSGMIPSIKTYITTITTQGALLTVAASTLATWTPTRSGVPSTTGAPDAMESMAVDRLLSSALCLNDAPCRLSEASREAVAWPSEWIWGFSIGMAVTIGGAALWL